MQTKQIAILFSGNGSNLEALIRALHNKYFCAKGDFVAQSGFCVGGITNNFVESKSDNAFKVEVVLALSNKKDAYGLTRARNLGIKTQVLESATYKDREEFDKNLVEILTPLKLDLCVLAGFMRILTPVFTDSIKAVNIHPSLLPLFKGAHGIKESFASPMKLG
ncbi:formyltransferase family protein, partial [Helicobacter sp.]|uniref:formyltransferase family protein n=1 Tax=Helicobacter sp. TaxID=218 RepID=UPI002A91D27C